MRVGVVGLGHIGASLLVRISSCVDAVGYDIDPAGCRYLRETWGVSMEESLESIVEGCDLVVVCVPTPVLASVLAELNDLQSGKQTLHVIEVSSVKPSIWPSFPNLSVLSSHPMAGREGAGATSLDPHVFEGATWLFAISGQEPDDLVGRGLTIAANWCGSYVLGVPQETHNDAIAAVSDLPHVNALALAQVICDAIGPEAVRAIAAGSYRGATRVARGSEARIAELLIPNQSALVPLVREMVRRLSEFAQLLGDTSLPPETVDEAIRAWVSEGAGSAVASARGEFMAQSKRQTVEEDLAGELVALGRVGRLVSEISVLKSGEWEFVVGSFA